MAKENLQKRDIFKLDELYGLFLRVLSVFYLAFSIRHWLILVGVADSATRFDTMTTEWQFAIAALSVMQPVAALGLWSKTRWGITVWLITAGFEILMYTIFQSTFGSFWSILLFHMGCIGVFLLYNLMNFLQARRLAN